MTKNASFTLGIHFAGLQPEIKVIVHIAQDRIKAISISSFSPFAAIRLVLSCQSASGKHLVEKPRSRYLNKSYTSEGNSFTLGDPFAHLGKKNITRPFWYLRGNVHFGWFNQYLCTGEHFQSDLYIFRFDFMFVKLHDMPPLFCFNVKTGIRFLLQQLLKSNLLQCLPSGDMSYCNINLMHVIRNTKTSAAVARSTISYNWRHVYMIMRGPLHNWVDLKISENGRRRGKQKRLILRKFSPTNISTEGLQFALGYSPALERVMCLRTLYFNINPVSLQMRFSVNLNQVW